MHAERMDDLHIGQIPEGDLVQNHIAFHVFWLNRSLYIGGLFFFIQQTEDTFCRRAGRLQFANNIGASLIGPLNLREYWTKEAMFPRLSMFIR